MIITIIIIYVIVLVLIEFLSIKKFKNPYKSFIDKSYHNIKSNIDNLDLVESTILKNEKQLKIDNYIGEILNHEDNYAFYILNNKWNIMKNDYMYNFKVPVCLILISKKQNELNIKYYKKK